MQKENLLDETSLCGIQRISASKHIFTHIFFQRLHAQVSFSCVNSTTTNFSTFHFLLLVFLMSSELQKQLQFVKSTFRKVQSKKNEKDSFLFDSKAAANLSTEDIYKIGIEGLAELITIDDRFIPFEISLLDRKSISFNRELQSDSVNKLLDETLHSCLSLLSLYFLEPACHKVLEYLVRRHRYILMFCFFFVSLFICF